MVSFTVGLSSSQLFLNLSDMEYWRLFSLAFVKISHAVRIFEYSHSVFFFVLKKDLLYFGEKSQLFVLKGKAEGMVSS